MTSFDPQMLLSGQYHDMLMAGLWMSLQYLAFGLCLSLPLGLLIALCRLSPFKALRALGACYVEVVRSIPLLAHMLFWYFGVPELLPAALKEALYEGPVESICAVLAIGFYTAAYMAEDIRSGIRAVPPVQLEAARAIGLPYLRAMRLVVDTGLHSQGWSREQALDYMPANSGMGRSDAQAEVDRYIADPGQAVAYKIGALTIQRLRGEAETRLGSRFDLRAFHAQVLGSGALPLPVLESKVRDWIAEQAAR